MRAKRMLLGKVTLIYFGLLVVVGVLINWASTRLVEESIIATTSLEAQRTASLLLHHLTPDDFAAPLAGPRYAEFHQFIQHDFPQAGLARLVLWNKDGMIIYADDQSLVGRVFPLEAGLAQALRGETVARIERLHGTESLAGGRAGERFVEIYAPLRFPGTGEVAGAYEVYLPYAPYGQEVARIQRVVLGFLAAGGAALFGAVALLFLGPARTIWRQRKEMEEALREKSWLLEQAAKATDEVLALEEVAAAVAGELKLETLLPLVTEKAAALMGAETAGIVLLDEERRRLRCAAAWGAQADQLLMLDAPADTGLGPWVMRTGQPVSVPDIWADERASDLARRLFGHRPAGMVPLVSSGKSPGCLFILGQEGGPPFSDHHLRLLAALGDHAAAAIDRAELYEAAQRRAQRLHALHDLSLEIASAIQEDLLRSLTEKSRSLLGADRAILRRLEESSGKQVCASIAGSLPAGMGPEELALEGGEGLAGAAAQQRRTLLARHYQDSPYVTPLGRRLGAACVACAPLCVGERLIGTLTVSSAQPKKWGPEDAELLTLFASQAAIALEKARLYQEAERKAQEAVFLAEAGGLFNSTLQLDELLQQVVVKCTAALGESAAIHLVEEGSPFLKTAAVYDVNPERAARRLEFYRQHPFRKDEGVMGLVATAGQPMLAADYPRHPAARPDMIEKFGTKSYLAVPIVANGKVLGVLSSAICESERRFGEGDLQLARSIADQAAVALEKARLFELLVRGKKEWEETFDAIADGIAVQDRGFTVRRANRAMAEFFGTTVAQMVGRKCYAVAHGRDGPCPDCFLVPERLTDQGTKLPPREMVRGERRLLATHHLLWDDAGQFLGSVVYVRDVTQERMLQETIARTESLRALGEMAGGVAHNFNNLLATILGRAELALQQSAEPSVRRSLEIIQQAALDGGQMTRRIQALTRRTWDQGMAPVGINEVVQEVVEATRPRWKDQAERAGIIIAVEMQLGPVPAVLGQASELREVLTGIVFNAIDAMPQGGRLVLRAWAEGGSVFIAVADNGIGMTEEVRRRVFDPFFTTKGERGSGLGLSVAYSIVARHQGDIKVESRVGQGSTFTVRLPAAPAALAVKAAEPSPPPAKGARILAIDDEPQVCEILRLMLEPDGHQVTLCASGEEGLRAFRPGAFDLVLTDLGMPGMSGWEVARAIKALSPTTPVALVTGWGFQPEPAQVRASGVDLVLTKPFRMAEVQRLVAEGFLLKNRLRPRKGGRNRGSDQSPSGKGRATRRG